MQKAVQEGLGQLEGWWRPASGFELLRETAGGRPTAWLAAKQSVPGGRFAEAVRPRMAPSDLETFAGLGKETDILTYSAVHGWLVQPTRIEIATGRSVLAEQIADWLDQAAAVKLTLDLINRAIQLSKTNSEVDRRELHQAVRNAGLETEATPGVKGQTTLAQGALALAALRVESRLADLVTFRIRPLPNGTISYVPRNQLGAIYLELARRLTARTPRWHNCDYCGRPFVASRRDARFHNDTCRSNARNHRRKASE